jgi:hypothetical protein
MADNKENREQKNPGQGNVDPSRREGGMSSPGGQNTPGGQSGQSGQSGFGGQSGQGRQSGLGGQGTPGGRQPNEGKIGDPNREDAARKGEGAGRGNITEDEEDTDLNRGSGSRQ